MDVSKHIVKSTGLVPMKFREPRKNEAVRRYRNFNPGEIGGVPPEDVEELVKSGWAEIHTPVAPEKK